MRTRHEIAAAAERLRALMGRGQTDVFQTSAVLIAAEVLEWIAGYENNFSKLLGHFPNAEPVSFRPEFPPCGPLN